MNWDFDGEGQWTAFSSVADDGCMFVWRISVCEDGTFTFSEPDGELTDRKNTFDSLRDEKTWCNEQDQGQDVAFVKESEECESQ
jgi:hypothetical protein